MSFSFFAVHFSADLALVEGNAQHVYWSSTMKPENPVIPAKAGIQ